MIISLKKDIMLINKAEFSQKIVIFNVSFETFSSTSITGTVVDKDYFPTIYGLVT